MKDERGRLQLLLVLLAFALGLALVWQFPELGNGPDGWGDP